MRLVVDTDTFYKLCICDLFEPALSLFGVSLADCGRLPALPYMLKKGKLPKKLGPEVCAKLSLIAAQMPASPEAGAEWLAKMTAVPEIDPGEAQLLATVAESDLLMLSGDKRAMKKIAEVEGLAAALRPVQGCLPRGGAYCSLPKERHGFRARPNRPVDAT